MASGDPLQSEGGESFLEGKLLIALPGMTDPRFDRDRFDVGDLADEIRIDQLCHDLLQIFCRELIERRGVAPEGASAAAYGASYFLCEFVIPDRRLNIFAVTDAQVRQFAGNWYIVRNLEPNLAELGDLLAGVAAFYDFCAGIGKVDAETAAAIGRACGDLDAYRQRIESFWAIEGDGYAAWEAACSLKG